MLLGVPSASAATGKTEISVTTSSTWGKILTLADHQTVYRFVPDPKGKSTCYGSCAVAWPPVLLAAGQQSPSGNHLHGLGVITRTGVGGEQVTYDGYPLYTFVGDAKPGQVNGNIKDAYGQWWTVNPTHPTAIPVARGHAAKKSTVPPGGAGSY
jgi:predicted lipoprotein with Yx(FWY)xxD motif